MAKEPMTFAPVCPKKCSHPNDGRHCHGNAFQDYWRALSEDEREWLRDKSTRYQQSLMASAFSANGRVEEER